MAAVQGGQRNRAGVPPHKVMFMGLQSGRHQEWYRECEMATEVAGTAEARKGAPTRQSLIFSTHQVY